MKDQGKIISLKGPLAQVELKCLSGCQKCAARHICLNKEQEKGLINVLNPINAGAGDEVTIHIPDNRYSQVLIILFSFTLMAALAGMFVGSFLSGFLSFSSSTGQIGGFFLGLTITAALLFYRFRKNKNSLYPEIINIIKKGDRHE
ncbi:MAG: SoxR reducing system RseC family protein [Acidobacteriota bacterium]